VNEALEFIGSVILVSLLIPNALFTIRYFLFSPYERTKEGRNLLAQKTAISALLIVLALTIILGPDYPGRPFVRLVVFSAITFFYWTEVVQLIKVQHEYPYNRFRRRKRN
jgi:hypothetical protein